MKIERPSLFEQRNYDKRGKDIVSYQTTEKIYKSNTKAVKQKNQVKMKQIEGLYRFKPNNLRNVDSILKSNKTLAPSKVDVNVAQNNKEL